MGGILQHHGDSVLNPAFLVSSGGDLNHLPYDILDKKYLSRGKVRQLAASSTRYLHVLLAISISPSAVQPENAVDS